MDRKEGDGIKMKNEIMIFENQNVKLEVNMKDETVWLSLEQMSELFDRDKSVISRHIKNAMLEEMNDNSVVAKFATTAKDGKTYQVDYYNLDMVLSVGYRVKSKNGIAFRRWANKILKDYLLKGYAVNQKRLEYLEKTVKLIDIATRLDEDLRNDEGYNMIKVIADYTRALDTLDRYDHQVLEKPKGNVDNSKEIKYEDCIEVINKMLFKKDSEIFGLERDKGLLSVIRNVYQEFGGKPLYSSIEEKACNFLYLIVKDHVFIDGNKRIGATLFLYFLNFYDLLKIDGKNRIEPETLVAVTLFVAQSNSKEKEIVIDLLMNILLEV